MWKRRLIDWSIILVLLLAFSTIFAALPSEVCEKEKGAYQEHCAAHSVGVKIVYETAFFLDRWNAVIVALSTLAVATFTWTLKSSTDKLWLAGEKQLAVLRQSVDETRRQFAFAHRPKLVVRRFYLRENREDGTYGPHIGFYITNVGGTPTDLVAKNIEVFGQYEGRNESAFLIGEKRFGGKHYAAGTSKRCYVFSDLGAPVFTDSVKEGRERLIVRGNIRYIDSEGIKRRTGFHRAYSYKSGTFERVNDPDTEYED